MESKGTRPGNLREAIEAARRILSSNPRHVESGLVETEAEQLLLAALRRNGQWVTRIELHTDSRRTCPETTWKLLEEWCRERASGRLLQHLTGSQTFLEHEYEVGPEVLVPRPETEQLVVEAIRALEADAPDRPKIGIEIGLGSGAISIELLSAFPELHIFASELRESAARRASSNAARILGPEWTKRLSVLMAPAALDVFGCFSALGARQADFLISNPPYLAKDDEVEGDVLAGEPHEALFPAAGPKGIDPLHFYREIAQRAERFVRPDGFIFLEIAHERARETSQLFTNRGWAAKLLKDLAGRDRVLTVRLPS